MHYLRTTIGLLALTAALLSCTTPLVDLSPFPCAQDGTCPESFACVPSVGCVAGADLESMPPFPCSGEAQRCPPSFVCVSDVGCVSSAKLPEYSGFACVEDMCPAGFYCLGDKGCIAAAKLAENAPFPCLSEKVCPGSGLTCVPSVGCVADSSVAARAPFACYADKSCPGGLTCSGSMCMADRRCTLSGKECTDPNTKCGIGADAEDNTVLRCVSRSGNKAAGEACSSDQGVDDCGAGLLCLSVLSTDGRYRCRELCDQNSDCDDSCFQINSVPTIGVCGDSCSGNPGSCGSGTACKPYGTTEEELDAACIPTGSGTEGAECDTDGDCGGRLSCWGGVCREPCEGARCQDGRLCGQFDGDLGFCQCRPPASFGQLDSCGSGKTCRPFGEAPDLVLWCHPNGTGVEGQTCRNSLDCGGGMRCITEGSTTACRRICFPPLFTSCNGQSCNNTTPLDALTPSSPSTPQRISVGTCGAASSGPMPSGPMGPEYMACVSSLARLDRTVLEWTSQCVSCMCSYNSRLATVCDGLCWDRITCHYEECGTNFEQSCSFCSSPLSQSGYQAASDALSECSDECL